MKPMEPGIASILLPLRINCVSVRSPDSSEDTASMSLLDKSRTISFGSRKTERFTVRILLFERISTSKLSRWEMESGICKENQSELYKEKELKQVWNDEQVSEWKDEWTCKDALVLKHTFLSVIIFIIINE